MSYRGRFAPSPTGPLHLGSLVAAAGSWLRARAQNGAWLVRMEDLDPPREVPGAAADILATLAAFGLESDEPVIYQSAREAAYRTAFDQLLAAGEVFACWCSRSDLEPAGGIHRGTCVAAPDHERAPAWRVRAPDATIEFVDAALGAQAQNLREAAGDFVIRRVEGWYAYQLAVVVDDAHQRISEVVRGIDLLDSTARQIHLQRLLDLPTPGYLHLPLVLDEYGRKLSKQDRSRPVDRRDPAPALRAALGFLGFDDALRGVPSNCSTLLAAALRSFDVARLPAAPMPCAGSPADV
ncbi:MAG TPA: tRNA glutamyl-Q(34) synthetase GluQRS [Rudaea sp.]|nr:tRNA glutamyl-Q(34) synthetase GluQRS [Rudaea sp.]HSC12054.1 tRNA glutamyl-Q(34) synthetase GluQRS [Rhodanobacteraceae bacterium]